MATLNMQQDILNQVIESEQQQEEIQLTELLPVKQSRIRENEIFKDTDANVDTTDALKILRSFTIVDNCCNDDEHKLCSVNLSFCRKIDQYEREKLQDNCKQLLEGNLQKKICEYDKKNVIDKTEIEKEKEKSNVQRFENESSIGRRKRKQIDKKSMIGDVIKSTKKRAIIDSIKSNKKRKK